MQPGQMEDLLDFLYMASTDPAVWPQFLASMAKCYDATVIGLLAQTASGGHYNVVNTLGLDPGATRLYNEHYSAFDPWYLALHAGGITEWVGPGSALCKPTQFEATEFYNDYWKRSVPAWFQAGTVFQSSGSSTVLSMHRERRRGDFDNDDTRVLRDLFPHVRRALTIHRRVIDLKQALAGAGGVIDALDIGLIGLGGGRTVCFTNAVADGYLRSADLLGIRNGRLFTGDPNASEALHNLIGTAHERVLCSLPGGSLTLSNDTRALHLAVFPMAGPRGIVPDQIRTLLTITDPAASPGSRETLLANLFHLTPSEIRVVMLLVAGLEPSEIAEQTRTTAGTVRFQLKMVYRKMGVTRQSQLVRLVSRLPGA